MSSDSRKERERLKEEYKAHYRKMREIKEQHSRAKKTQDIVHALKSMDKSQMLETFDDFLYSVKHKLASVEARLDVAMESLSEEDEQQAEQELDQEMTRERAQDTLRQVKMEMGLLYEEIERQADSIDTNKTIGPPQSQLDNDQSPSAANESNQEQ
ncbi:MAG: hypothetical protein U5J63_11935 [Fodinibius sp.]|nr:hypothetical protein [Fodinibius sp.]